MLSGVCVGGPKHRQRAVGHHRSMVFETANLPCVRAWLPNDMISMSYTAQRSVYHAETFRVRDQLEGDWRDFTIWVADGVKVEDALHKIFARARRQRRGMQPYHIEFNRDMIVFFQPRGLTLAQAVARVMKKFCRKPRRRR